ncbi:SpoIIE family protein phosphatase [Streptomyces sp. NPDC060194]|uniref:SpoIIE family protein phosphatase n=1 Tax=Streptomyces sp. NPDC060194 TaxID=3347069 RepID=UPI00365F41BB
MTAAGGREAPARSGAGDAAEVDRTVETLASLVDELRGEVGRARAEADVRVLVGIATGILVERGHGGPAEAARRLKELAATTQVPVPELAADIVHATADDPVAEALPGRLPRQAGQGRAPAEVTQVRAAEAGALGGDAQAAAESLLTQALAPLGATGLAIWAARGQGALTLAGQAGFPAVEADAWRSVPPGAGTLAQRALAERGPQWFGKLPADALGIGCREGHTGGARALLPAQVGGRYLGVLEVCWPHPQPPLSAVAERQLDALAEVCAHTLSSADMDGTADELPGGTVRRLVDLADGLLDPAMVLQPLLDDHGAVVDFRIAYANRHFSDLAGRSRAALTGSRLLEAYPLMVHPGGLYEQALRVHATGEPFRAERMVLSAAVEQVSISAVAAVGIGRYGDVVLLSWRIEDEATRLAALLGHAQRLGRFGGFEENTVSGEVLWNNQLFDLYGLPRTAHPVPIEQLHHHAHPDDAVAIGRFVRQLLHHRRPTSTAFRLQRRDGVVRHIRIVAEPVLDPAGHLVAVRGAYQDVSSQHWTEVALAATRDRLADTEERADERNRLALQLQQAIMPPARAPIDASGLRAAVRYRPAETEHLVGGDWYDTVVMPNKQVLLVVGDVAGHGIEAATGMVVLRNALRGLAATGAGPAQLMGWLNTVAHHLTAQVTATAICGLYDSETRTLRWARAGHPPPVLVRDGAASALSMPRGILLGAIGEATYDEHRITLEHGDRLLMYTDGLIERRDRSMERSMEQLLEVAGAQVPNLEEHLDRLLTHSRSDTDDDTCLIGVQLH